MTREQHLAFCKKCTNRDFNITEGILCGLTGKKADFDESCINFSLDKKKVLATIPSKKVRPNEKRALLATYMIWAVLVIDLFSVISNYFQYRLLEGLKSGVSISDAELTNNDLRVTLISVLYLVIYLLSGIAFIQWFRRAYNNLAARTKTDHSEGWAAGGWFVPIISLYRPYKIMKELFQKTDTLIKGRTGEVGETKKMSLVGCWWTLWILVGFIANYSFKVAFKSDTLEGLSNSTIADIISSLLEVPVGILAILIISAFAKMENTLVKLEAEEIEQLEAA